LKNINDRYGHVTGSRALCRVANVLSFCCRDIDTPARFGGDEFALILPETNSDAANLVARRIHERVANDGEEPKLSISVGAAAYPQSGETIETLLSAADRQCTP
jgi:diguanylate cyclase (GGDEF)-like protein